MKKIISIIIVFISISAFGQDIINTNLPISKKEYKKQDNFIRENIIRKWKDQNSTIFFFRSAEVFTAWQ